MSDHAASTRGSQEGPTHHTDRARWEEIVRSVNPAAMQVVIGSSMSKKLREHCSPEDIWQEALTHAWRDRAQHRWEGPNAFRAWLFEIARNRIREVARGLSAEKRGAGERTARFSELASSSTTSIGASFGLDSQTPSRIVSKDERRIAAREAVASLPPELRDVVRMHLLEEQTMEAIAAKLGIGVSAAWHRFRKGSEMLARLLPGGIGDASSAGP
jgi:RNA polymerase sigma factor (sigma-70 family)